MEELLVEVQEDHLKSLISASPVKAIEELIYNALDADATTVRINFLKNDIGGIGKIQVQDDGVGIHGNNKKYFKGLGGSWKREVRKTPTKKRIIHGKFGKGRFKAFALGEMVTWNSCFSENGKKYKWSIGGNSAVDIRLFHLSKFQECDDPSGSEVVIENVNGKLKGLQGQNAIDVITADLALYLTNYPDIKIYYDNTLIEPSRHIIAHKKYKHSVFDNNEEIPLEVDVYEWNLDVDKALYFCNKDGFVLEKRKMNLYTSGYRISVYVKSAYLEEQYENGNLLLGDFDSNLKKIVEIGRCCAKEYCREKTVIAGQGIIEKWKEEDIYPYSGSASNDIESAERQIFEVVALNINEHLVDFETYDVTTKKLSFSLVKEALESNPTSLGRILEDVIKLPKDKIEDLNTLLKHTTLSDIISASKIVANRIQFLTGLESLIYDYKYHTKERKQLHRLLEGNTWIFGEEFHMTVSDQSLNAVLNAHLDTLRPQKNSKKVNRSDGKTGIVDLMLSRGVPESNPEEKNHLIIELKRPSQKIDFDVFNQITSYAQAVSADERFSLVPAKWSFWAISNEIDTSVEMLTKQNHRPEGLVNDQDGIKIWLLPWSKIINKCKSRLYFYQQNLKFETDTACALQYLQGVYSQYIPDEARQPS